MGLKDLTENLNRDFSSYFFTVWHPTNKKNPIKFKKIIWFLIPCFRLDKAEKYHSSRCPFNSSVLRNITYIDIFLLNRKLRTPCVIFRIFPCIILVISSGRSPGFPQTRRKSIALLDSITLKVFTPCRYSWLMRIFLFSHQTSCSINRNKIVFTIFLLNLFSPKGHVCPALF